MPEKRIFEIFCHPFEHNKNCEVSTILANESGDATSCRESEEGGNCRLINDFFRR
jgi:hypothetical protein